MVYVRPYGDPTGSTKPITIENQPRLFPDPIEPPSDSGDTSLYTPVNTTALMQVSINLALPPYELNAPTYQWYKDDQILAEQPRYQNTFQRGYEYCGLLIDWAQESDSGVYTCVIKNSTNSVTSEPVFLRVAYYEPQPPPWGGYQDNLPPDGEVNPYADPT
jgi:hypothetical protein